MVRTIRCNQCKKIFAYEGPLPSSCPNCKTEKQRRYMQIRALVKEMPGITALEIHERLDVPISEILEHVKEGSLEIVSDLTDDEREMLKKYRNYIGGNAIKDIIESMDKSSVRRDGDDDLDDDKKDTYKIGR